MLLNGEVFDECDFWAQLGHGTIIYGVDQGMRGLCVGEKRRMIMHPDWGYGSRGTGNIPPNAVLVFDVHLKKVERPGEGVETLEEKFAENGGVSKDKKLLIKELYKKDPEDCKMSSFQNHLIHWHYKGKLLDGHIFDQGKFHAKLGHGQVITGVDKAMRGLCVGERRRMIIHPDWAYGDGGVPGTIPPKSVLIFDVELLSIEKPDGSKDVFDPSSNTKKPVLPDHDKLKRPDLTWLSLLEKERVKTSRMIPGFLLFYCLLTQLILGLLLLAHWKLKRPVPLRQKPQSKYLQYETV